MLVILFYILEKIIILYHSIIFRTPFLYHPYQVYFTEHITASLLKQCTSSFQRVVYYTYFNNLFYFLDIYISWHPPPFKTQLRWVSPMQNPYFDTTHKTVIHCITLYFMVTIPAPKSNECPFWNPSDPTDSYPVCGISQWFPKISSKFPQDFEKIAKVKS